MLVRSLACLLVLASAAVASAQQAAAGGTAVVVLGIRSVEGDDDVAHDLTAALREAARGIEGWTVSPAAVSMAQMALAHGCEDVDVACLAEMARGLKAARIVYGTLRRNSARDDFDFAFNLALFDAEVGNIQRSLDDTIPRFEVTGPALEARAQRLIHRLAGATQGGSIAVQANVATADVLINGQPVGQLQNGELQYDGLEPGAYRVEIRAHGHAPFVQTIEVETGKPTTLNAVLREGIAPGAAEVGWSAQEPVKRRGGHAYEWLGWTLIGVGASSAIGAVVAWTQIASIDTDPLLVDYRDAVARGNREAEAMGEAVETDVCAAADDDKRYTLSGDQLNRVRDLCSEADTWELLQYVFLGTAVAAGGIGTYLVLSAGDGGMEEDEMGRRKTPTFALRPRLDPERPAITATLRF